MTRKKILVILTLTIAVIGFSYAYYMFNMSHRNVVDTDAEIRISASELVEEYLRDPAAANEKYLSEDGDSKILALSGKVKQIGTDFAGNREVLILEDGQKAGIKCTFTEETNHQADGLVSGDHVTVKGVIYAGAAYDEDLGMYENVVLGKCSLIK